MKEVTLRMSGGKTDYSVSDAGKVTSRMAKVKISSLAHTVHKNRVQMD